MNAAVMNNRLKQSLDWYGHIYTFYRKGLNQYKEKTESLEEVCAMKCLYHNGSANHGTLNISDAAITWMKETPYLMTFWEEAKQLQLGDFVKINGIVHKITTINNINEENVMADISLEVME